MTTTTLAVQPDDRPYAWVEVDLAAIEHNAAHLRRQVGGTELCAVVKGWGYGHGAVRAAQAAVRGGASWLGVALVAEARELRLQGQLTEPILVLAEAPNRQMVDIAQLDGVRPTVYSAEAISAAAAAVRDTGRTTPLPVHLKIDTGMHRVGAAPEAALHLARKIGSHPELELEGVWTHLASSEDPAEDEFTDHQLAVFARVLDALARDGIVPRLVHAANTAGALAHPAARMDLFRSGIGIYGIAPRAGMAEAEGLRPAMALKARVSLVKQLRPGESVSYGRHFTATEPTVIATVPIGYYDGVPRRLGITGGHVLIGGKRRRIVGAVTMDQLMVDCGDDAAIRPRDEVVLLGCQGDECIDAWEWADRLGTIAYEVVCGIPVSRVPRRYL